MKRVGTIVSVASALVFCSGAGAAAQTGACFDVNSCKVAPDRPASLLIFPKIEVDPENGVDTVIQLTSTSEQPVSALCNYINATRHCSNDNTACESNLDCPGFGQCVAGWTETDFRVTLTRLQPLSWNASRGLSFLPCDLSNPNRSVCIGRNEGRIPPVAETPFLGELKCVQVDDSDAPVDFNELIGEATTIRAIDTLLDVSKYNAIGVQALPGVNDHDNRLCLGGIEPTDACPSGAEYAGCPQTLIMNHFFEGASFSSSPPVSNTLTLVPCAEDLLNQVPASVTVQVLIFNEFEQRTSTSLRVRCFTSRRLADLDTGEGPEDDSSSIFGVGTQGTPAGQTRLTGVASQLSANGILGVLEEFRPCDQAVGGQCGSSVNLHQQGQRPLTDIIQLP